MAGFWKTTQYITRRLILKNGATIGDTSGNVFVGGNIIPQAHVTNVLYVSPTFVSNTLNNFKTATSAVARAISIATAQMPVVIKVQPGVYAETVTLAANIYLQCELGVSGLTVTENGGVYQQQGNVALLNKDNNFTGINKFNSITEFFGILKKYNEDTLANYIVIRYDSNSTTNKIAVFPETDGTVNIIP